MLEKVRRERLFDFVRELSFFDTDLGCDDHCEDAEDISDKVRLGALDAGSSTPVGTGWFNQSVVHRVLFRVAFSIIFRTAASTMARHPAGALTKALQNFRKFKLHATMHHTSRQIL